MGEPFFPKGSEKEAENWANKHQISEEVFGSGSKLVPLSKEELAEKEAIYKLKIAGLKKSQIKK